MTEVIRKIFYGGLLLCWLPFAAGVAAEFEEGTDYQRLATPVTTSTEDKIEVAEVFWYGCPHCFRLEPKIEEWLETKPAYVEFVRVPAALGRSWEIDAKAFYVASILGILDKMHQPLFDAIHVQGQRLNTPEKMAEFFAKHGVDKETFDKVFNSFELETNFRRSQNLVRQYGITGVPAMIVNGKYLTNGSMAGSEERLFEVINYLIKLEAAQA